MMELEDMQKGGDSIVSVKILIMWIGRVRRDTSVYIQTGPVDLTCILVLLNWAINKLFYFIFFHLDTRLAFIISQEKNFL